MAFEKIKKSKFRTQIERMIAEGISPRKISTWLHSQGEDISYLSIHEYKGKEFNPLKAALNEMDVLGSSDEIFENGKRTFMADLAFLNRVIETADKKINQYFDEPGMLPNFKILFDAAHKAIELKQKLRGEAGDDGQTIVLNQFNFSNFEELRGGVEERLRQLDELGKLEAAAVGS